MNSNTTFLKHWANYLNPSQILNLKKAKMPLDFKLSCHGKQHLYFESNTYYRTSKDPNYWICTNCNATPKCSSTLTTDGEDPLTSKVIRQPRPHNHG